MTGRDRAPDDLAPHIAEPLRATEELSNGVAGRVMDVVRAEGARRYPRVGRRDDEHWPDGLEQLGRDDAAAWFDESMARWWRRRSVQLSPAAALAWAAGLVAIASIGTLRVAASSHDPSRSATQSVAVDVVRFVFREPAARHVAVVGDFNGWAKDATPLVATSEQGSWAVSVTIPKGRHEYAFIVDGNRWSPDPFAARVADEFGTESSVVTVGDAMPTGDDPSRKSD